MAKVKKYYGKKPYKKWLKFEMDAFGNNPYLGLIHSIMYKEDLEYVECVGGSEQVQSQEVLKKYRTAYSDDRHTIRFFDGAHLIISKLSANATSMLWYLGKNLSQNMNIASMNRKACILFCGINDQVVAKLNKEVEIGKVPFIDKKLITERENRLYRNALKELEKIDAIKKTLSGSHFWINPKIMMNGKTHHIPASHNNFNLPNPTPPDFVTINEHLRRYKGIDIVTQVMYDDDSMSDIYVYTCEFGEDLTIDGVVALIDKMVY